MKTILESYLFEAFSNAADNVYIYVCEMEKDLSRWSLNAIEYFNLPSEYMQNANSIWRKKIHPEDLAKYDQDIDNVFSGKSSQHFCQYRAMNKYGNYVWLECRGSVINQNGTMVFAGMMTRLAGQNKYDPLTNLYTYFEFFKYDFIHLSSGYALLIGINGFRRILNSYGYSFADSIMIEYADNLQKCCKDDYNIFRLEGDEFIIIMPSASSFDVSDFFSKICGLSKRLGTSTEHIVSLSLSGGALQYPRDASNNEEVISNLEHSLEQAKHNSHSNLIFFTEEIAQSHNRAIILREELTCCINNDFKGFELFFQPIVNSNNKQIYACEALLRWHSENFHNVGTEEFISLLEASGQINDVGVWVMENVFKYAKKWSDNGVSIKITFNVSYHQLTDDILVSLMIDLAKEYRINPEMIIMELTESCKIENPETLKNLFDRLRKHGFQIALDDFGIAYSSLALIRELPADYIKVAHSFVRKLNEKNNSTDRAIIASILKLCEGINAHSIIEGIENEKIEKIISDLQPSYLQGYYYSRPISVENFEELININN